MSGDVGDCDVRDCDVRDYGESGVYGFEDSGPTHALVMELVDGPTLADRIEQGAVPLAEALAIAKRIGSALEIVPLAAHSPSTYVAGTGCPAASAALTSRAWRHCPRYSNPGQLHVTSASTATIS